ncbi:MAG: hypothetical protein Q4A54_02255 [Parabacteroides sp.]|nr:hypothetical protein [Parabacteroides sp.]
MTEMNIVSSYVLRSKDIPLIDFSLYVSNEIVFDTLEANYSIKIDKVHTENKHLSSSAVKPLALAMGI